MGVHLPAFPKGIAGKKFVVDLVYLMVAGLAIQRLSKPQ